MNLNVVDVAYVASGVAGKKGSTIPYTIIPVEAHWSRRTRSNGFCRETWLKLIRRVEKDPRCFVILVGDIIDADRPSTRDRRAIMGLGRSEVLDEDDVAFMDELRNHLLPDLRRIKDKIVGAVDGDHYRIFGSRSSTKFMMDELGIPKAYLGERMGWVRLLFKRKANVLAFDIFVRHGKGSATTFGTDVNKLVTQSVGFDAQLYVGGHTHRQWFVKVPYLYCGKYDIKQRFQGYARAGSLLRGFLYGESTYAEAAEYSPLSIGWPEIYLYISSGRDSNHNLKVTDMKGLT